MAITHIHPIVGNVSGTIKYIMNDKIESVGNIDEWKQKNGNIQSHIAYTINDKSKGVRDDWTRNGSRAKAKRAEDKSGNVNGRAR